MVLPNYVCYLFQPHPFTTVEFSQKGFPSKKEISILKLFDRQTPAILEIPDCSILQLASSISSARRQSSIIISEW